MAGPLEDVRVAELTDLRGAMAGRILADLGAHVIKIEPSDGERDRLRPPFAGDEPEGSTGLPFLYRNANKRGVILDLGTESGRRLLDEIAHGVDVLIENLGPWGHEKYGLEPERLEAEHPHLIVVSLSDFGLSGPRARWRAEPLVAFAASGALFNSGFPDMPPCWLPGYTAHDCGAVFAAAAAVAGLLKRERNREGSQIEISVQEAAIGGLYPWAIPIADYQHIYPMIPSSLPRIADGPYMVLPTKGGYVRFVIGSPQHWRGFLELVGRPEELLGEEWEHGVYRLLCAETLRSVCTPRLRERSRPEVLAEATRLGVAIAPVNTLEQFVDEPQTHERGFFLRTGFPIIDQAPLAGPPFKLSRTGASVRRPAPLVAEHLEEVIGEVKRVGAGRGAAPRGVRVEPGKILAGIRVINLGVGAVVPEACGLLGDLGAEVIKLESRANMDFLRKASPNPTDHDRSFVFNTECRGQKSVALNLATGRGREIALEIMAKADVVAENNRGGVVETWGLDYEAVRIVKPDIIYLSSQGYGRGGPLSKAVAFGPLNGAFAGTCYLWNHADAPYPASSTLNHPDHVASRLASVVILAALHHKSRTGEGQFIDMSQAEVAAYLLGEFYLEGALTGKAAGPSGNRVPYAAPHGVYRCQGEDRWVAIAVVGEQAWEDFVTVVEQPQWREEDRFRDLASRLANQDELDSLVSQWTGRQTAEQVAKLLQEAGVSACEVQNGDDHRADLHLRERRAIVTVHHPEVGPERHIANPIRVDGAPVDCGLPSPRLGADTIAVLKAIVGLSDGEIARLTEQKVLW
jgi:crotonobetainyl-CoA:carnitine CoA-transferase CaiB-like acyl-CoA transferase